MLNNSLPLVSIAIPTYNRADSYLKDALNSALAQTYPNVEIIVSDNASTDHTETLVKELKDPRIRYFKQSRNIGMLNNSNFCLEQAQGAYFLLLCDDDIIDSDIVQVCMEAVQYNTRLGVILTGIRIIDANGSVIREDNNRAEGLSTADFMLSWFDHKVSLYLCSTLYNTQRLKEKGGFRSKKNLYDDAVALFKLATLYGRHDVYDVKASFRMHGSNTGGTADLISDWCEDSLYLLDIMCDLVPTERDIIREKGHRSLCVQNYGRASRIKDPLKRLYAYFIVYKRFNYSYTLIHCLLGRNIIYNAIYRMLSLVKRKAGEAVS